MKKALLSIVLLFAFILSIQAQPQYYNYNNGTVNNSFPLNQPAGKMSQTVVPAGTFGTPSPAPAGNITKLYFRIAATYPLGPATYSTFKIMLQHVPSEFVTAGSFITGAWDTVYKRDTVTLYAAVNTWLEFTLDHSFAYNPTQPLAISMEQCGATGTTTGYSLCFTTATGSRRIYSVGGCPFVYSGVSTNIINVGVNISTAPTVCNKIAGTFCPLSTYPVLPTATYFSSAAWLGDTLYVQTPTTTGVGATTINRYTFGGTWSTGVPCLVGVCGASLTACNGKLYLIGGGTTGVTTGTNNVQEYNPATGTWTAKAPLPAALSAHNSVNWGDSVIFVIGGPYTGAGTNLAVHYYRPASNTWGTISNSLPSGQGRRTFAMGICGNKIIISCGYNTAYLATTYVGTIGSDASQITWVAGPNAYTSLSRPAGTAYDKYFFLVGGDTNGTAGKNPRISIFNTETNTWLTHIMANPNPVSNIMAGVTAKCVNDTVRVFQPGGYTTVASNPFIVTGCGPIITSVTPVTAAPNKYNLAQNYPNPFNPVTKISYDIPKSGLVTLRIYDILGKEVSVLVNEVKSPGSYIVEFDGASFSSGTYFYRLESGGFISTKKMVLIK